MGSSTIFIILALIIWGASRYMKKSWDIDEEETTPYEPEIPEDTTIPSSPTPPPSPTFSYEKENPEEQIYSEQVVPIPSIKEATSMENLELQKKLAAYTNQEIPHVPLSVAPIRKTEPIVSWGTEIRQNFDLRKAVVYSEILNPKYKEY